MEELRNIRLVVCYDGSAYHGWQRQKDHITIQEVMESRIARIVGHDVKLIGSGRTDSGVHAYGQVCNFKTTSAIPCEPLQKGLNSLLPEDIYVKEVVEVPLKFHARYSAKSKTYEYRILNRQEPDIFLRRYVWHIPVALDIEAMKECVPMLVGTHDFSSFMSSGGAAKSPIRTVLRASLETNGAMVHFTIEANGFLKHMVRNIVGTLVKVGFGKVTVEGFQEIFFSRDRKLAGIKAPAQGLFLLKVSY